MANQITPKLLAADQLPDHVQMGLFNLTDLDPSQQARQRVLVGQFFQVGKEVAQVGRKDPAGHFLVGMAPGTHLKGKTQNPVDHQHRQLVPEPAWIPWIGDFAQAFEQDRQHRPIDLDLLTDRIHAGCSFFLLRLVRTGSIGLVGLFRRTESLVLLPLAQFPLPLFARFLLLLDRFSPGARDWACSRLDPPGQRASTKPLSSIPGQFFDFA